MRVVIVGGGSAGWIAATLLDSALNGTGPKHVQITLVESARIGRIGVGEATIPTMRRTLSKIRVPERDFMRQADATFKQSIRFVNWARADGHEYVHPFDRVQVAGRDQYGLRWLRSDRAVPFSKTVSAQPNLAAEYLAPKTAEQKDYEGVVSYAYHMDAEKFAGYLAELCRSRGLTHIVDDVVSVDLNARGDIRAVQTEGGQRLEGDLFLDCTGFARRLIGREMGARLVDYSDWLLCDRAAAARLPHDPDAPKGEINPFTTATALSNGWCWDIGLQNRRGVGYVHASAFIDEESAERELRAFQSIPDDVPVRHLKFQSGRLDTPWMRNCIGIGLAGGFLEPLESTGLFFVEEAVDYLIELFPRFGEFEQSAAVFNRKMAERYEESLDFINLHYCLTQRRDTDFWREVARPQRITPSLSALLARWDQKPPSRLDFTDNTQLFAHVNFEYILYGMGWTPKAMPGDDPNAPPANRSLIEKAELQGRTMLSPHRAFLDTYLAG